ncbi:MAG: D-lyxose/D-mannose family sugar isomerase [Anaerolineae bacterium]|nr:D-lyxose/D-mannose family sugar isomerase [Anaerolineae bacterium]
MKRSKVNQIMREAEAFLKQHQFYLPPFAHWTPEDWQAKGEEACEIADHGLGWDITDFGLGKYDEFGLLLFTIRNGDKANLAQGRGKVYAEKILLVGDHQMTPFHFHWHKTEDIINRGGGKLMLRLFNSTEDEGLAETDIQVSLDGVVHTFKAGDTVCLNPGESITLTTGLYHNFWAEDGMVLAGEVSTVNDDHTDNRFYEPVGRFSEIEEDEPPLHLLIGDYAQYYQPARA